MLKFSRALVSCIFAVAGASCVALDSMGIDEAGARRVPTRMESQTAANFGAVRFVAKIFSECTRNEAGCVSFEQWYKWLRQSPRGSPGRWLAAVLSV